MVRDQYQGRLKDIRKKMLVTASWLAISQRRGSPKRHWRENCRRMANASLGMPIAQPAMGGRGGQGPFQREHNERNRNICVRRPFGQVVGKPAPKRLEDVLGDEGQVEPAVFVLAEVFEASLGDVVIVREVEATPKGLHVVWRTVGGSERQGESPTEKASPTSIDDSHTFDPNSCSQRVSSREPPCSLYTNLLCIIHFGLCIDCRTALDPNSALTFSTL